MTTVSFHPEARAEALSAAEYYEAQQRGLGRRFVENLADAVARIERYPHLHRVIEPGVRQCRVPRFPYGILFKHAEERIVILAVMHLRQRPGYWRARSEPDDDNL